MKVRLTPDTNGLLQARPDEPALGKLVDLFYGELHQTAHCYMVDERPEHTHQTKALIHEVLRLVDTRQLRFQDRAHFLAVCARLMRRILIDCARAREDKKRGAGQLHLSIDEAPDVSAESSADISAIDQALNRLSVKDERKAKIVELKFFRRSMLLADLWGVTRQRTIC